MKTLVVRKLVLTIARFESATIEMMHTEVVCITNAVNGSGMSGFTVVTSPTKVETRWRTSFVDSIL